MAGCDVAEVLGQLVVIVIPCRLGAGDVQPVELVAEAGDRAFDFRQPLAIHQAQRHDLRGDGHLHILHPADPPSLLLDFGGAGWAIHPGDAVTDGFRWGAGGGSHDTRYISSW